MLVTQNFITQGEYTQKRQRPSYENLSLLTLVVR